MAGRGTMEGFTRGGAGPLSGVGAGGENGRVQMLPENLNSHISHLNYNESGLIYCSCIPRGMGYRVS